MLISNSKELKEHKKAQARPEVCRFQSQKTLEAHKFLNFSHEVLKGSETATSWHHSLLDSLKFSVFPFYSHTPLTRVDFTPPTSFPVQWSPEDLHHLPLKMYFHEETQLVLLVPSAYTSRFPAPRASLALSFTARKEEAKSRNLVNKLKHSIKITFPRLLYRYL